MFDTVPDQPSYSREELLVIMRREREAFERMMADLHLPLPFGQEFIFQTDAGLVRTLGYNMGSAGRLPLIVDLHGSGFVMCHADMDDPYMPDLAAGANARVLSIDYSLAPEHPFPEALNECYAVLEYVTRHADVLGVDASRIGLLGHSAGGNLCAALCEMNIASGSRLGVCCAALDYPPLDIYTEDSDKPGADKEMPAFVSRIYNSSYCSDREARRNPLVSPLFAGDTVLIAFPPTLLITAGLDTLRDEAKMFADRLLALGVMTVHRDFANCKHGFTHQPSPEAMKAWELMSAFFMRYLHA